MNKITKNGTRKPKMGHNSEKMEKVSEVIFEHPEQRLTVRDIAHSTKMSKSTVQRYISVLQKDKVIDKENKLIITNYTKFLKAFHMIKKIYGSGLIECIEQKKLSTAIIVFGSVRKGEYTKESDIDLFVETTKTMPLDISSFEKKLRHKIQLFLEADVNKLPKELFNNVINGIKLSGYMKIK